MYYLIALTAFLVAATYLFRSSSANPKYRSFDPSNAKVRFDRKQQTTKDNPFQGRHKNPPPKREVQPVDRGNMLRCHNCSVFFAEARVVNEVIDGHILEFCSTTCRRNFVATVPR